MTHVTLNGEPAELATGSTVEDVVLGLSPSARGIAVAVNGAVVVRSAWRSELLREGDEVEVLTAAQGG